MKIGTCSWKFPEWRWIYGESGEEKGFNHLEHYSQFYSAVEIDQWFWSLFASGAKLPNTETVKIYADSVPDDFLFTVKAPNSITLTHHYAKQSSRYEHMTNQPNPHFLDIDLLKRFLDTLEAMESKLGPVMFQF
jgi:uncharacterized protein YecE (DUF72 family)